MFTTLAVLTALVTWLGLAGCDSTNSNRSSVDPEDSRCTLDSCGADCGVVAGFRVDKTRGCYTEQRVVLACKPRPGPSETAPATTYEGCFVDSETGDTYVFVNTYANEQLPGFTECPDPRAYQGIRCE